MMIHSHDTFAAGLTMMTPRRPNFVTLLTMLVLHQRLKLIIIVEHPVILLESFVNSFDPGLITNGINILLVRVHETRLD